MYFFQIHRAATGNDGTDYSMKGRTYRFMEDKPMYPFGFELSYTNFVYKNIKADKNSITKNQSFDVEATVTNSGKVASDEVVQMYISVPQQNYLTPLYSLKGFQRISLKPSESKVVRFTVTPEEMQIYNTDGKAVIPNGELKIYIGGSSPVERSQELGASKMVTTSVAIKN